MNTFISNILGDEELNERGRQVGLKVGIVMLYKNKYSQSSTPALGGNTYPVKEVIKAGGGRFDGIAKVWTFNSREQMIAVIAAIEANLVSA